jgi:hypothetical protein
MGEARNELTRVDQEEPEEIEERREEMRKDDQATSYEFPSGRYPTDMQTTGALRCIRAGNLSTLSRDQAYLWRRPGEQTPPLKRGPAWREQRG